jgi:hypothetical protein
MDAWAVPYSQRLHGHLGITIVNIFKDTPITIRLSQEDFKLSAHFQYFEECVYYTSLCELKAITSASNACQVIQYTVQCLLKDCQTKLSQAEWLSGSHHHIPVYCTVGWAEF